MAATEVHIGDVVDHVDCIDTLLTAMHDALGAGDFARIDRLCDRVKAEIVAGPQPAILTCLECHRALDDIDLDLGNGRCTTCSTEHPEIDRG